VNRQIDKWRAGLARTSQTGLGRVANLLGLSQIDSTTWDDLEAALIQADLGVPTTLKIVDNLKEAAHAKGWTKMDDLMEALRGELSRRLLPPPDLMFNPDGPTVVLIVGVNGSGKTTSAAKLGKHFSDLGKSVLLAGADTFRAAAGDQLQRWGDKLGLRVLRGQPDGDAGAVVYDAVQSALSRKNDIVLVDTAGRLHTRYNLMEELKKVQRVAAKTLPGAPHAVWLVMDATTGQNAMQQAKAFKEAVEVDGVILAKLDSSARGGMVFAIQEELALPVLFAGLGEGADDLVPFDPGGFLESILPELD